MKIFFKHILIYIFLLTGHIVFSQSHHTYKYVIVAHPWVLYEKISMTTLISKDTLHFKNPRVIVADSGTHKFPMIHVKNFGDFSFFYDFVKKEEGSISGTDETAEKLSGRWQLRADVLKLIFTKIENSTAYPPVELNYKILKLNDASLTIVRKK